MAEGKYGRLFTEADVRLLVNRATHDADDEDLNLEALARDGELTFPADEPLFLLRGQDVAAPEAIRTYFDVCAGDDDQLTSDKHLAAVKAAGEAIEAWQQANPDRVKIPD